MLLYALSDCSLCSISRTAAFTRFGNSMKDQLIEFNAQVVRERLGDDQWISIEHEQGGICTTNANMCTLFITSHQTKLLFSKTFITEQYS